MTFYYGAHLSIKKGIIKTIDQAINLNCNLLQIFLSNPMSTKQKLNYTDDECLRIKDKLNFSNTKLVIHLPYVINLSKPIINLERTRKFASDFLWEMRKNPLVKEESFRILKLHTMSGGNDNES